MKAKTLKKGLGIVLSMAMTMSLFGCGSGDSTKEQAADTSETSEVASKDSDTDKGGKDMTFWIFLDPKSTEDPRSVVLSNIVKEYNETNQYGNTVTVESFNYSVFESQAIQAAAAGTNTIPILGTAVTDYGVALDIDNFDGTVGGNISGTADLAPLDGQADMLHELFPDAKKVGLLYCSAEANSQFQVDTIKEYLEKLGYTCEYYAFSDSNDLSSVCTSAANDSDVIYVPTDNTVANNTEIVNNICTPAGVPVIAGEEGICKGCGVATLSISYYDLGVATGKMAVKVLQGEDISTMPVEYAPTFTKEYVASRCEAYGITVPDDYVALEE